MSFALRLRTRVGSALRDILHPDSSEMRKWPIWLVGAVGFLVCCSILTTAWFCSATNYDSVLSGQRRNLKNIATVLAEHISRSISAAMLAQRHIGDFIKASGIQTPDDFRSRLSQHDVHEMLKFQLSGHAQLNGLILHDANGNLVNSTRRWPIPSVRIDDRAYFKQFASEPSLTQLITEPVKNRADGTWTAYLVRKITGPDGAFIGLSLAALDLNYFESLFSSVEFDGAHAITLFRSDSTLLARWPRVEHAQGKQYGAANDALGSGKSGFSEIVSHIDGVPRFRAVQAVPHYPLVVSVAIDREEALAQWRTYSFTVWSAAIVACAAAALAFALLIMLLLEVGRKDELIIREQKRRLAVALDHMSHGLVKFDAEGRLVLWNRRYLEIYRMREADVRIGMSFEDLLAAKANRGTFAPDFARYSAELAEHLKANRTHQAISKLPDGRIIKVANQPTIGAAGWVSTHEDITDLHTANEARNQSRAFLRSIIESVPVAIVVKEAKSLRYVLVNRCAESLMGLRSEEIIGKTVSELLGPEDAATITAGEREVFASKTGSSVEHVFQSPTQGKRLIQVIRKPILDENSECKYLVSVIDDVTERRNTERTLAHANKMEAISSLTGGVAHDFNNLLLVMVGNLDLLIEELADVPSAREKLDAVLDACLRGSELTEQMLSFSRKQSLQPKSIEINASLRRTAQLLQRTIGDRITLQLDLAESDVVTHVDEGQLQAAVINIAVNARDAMPEGGVLRICSRLAHFVKEREGLAAGLYGAIEISDTGHGMNEEVLSRVFEPYFTTKEHGKGTGLGLSIVYGFVRQSGGGITAESISGAGSKFTLYLPLASEIFAPASTVNSNEPPPIIKKANGTTVLVVDDNDASRKTVLGQVKQLGFGALEAANAEAALALIDTAEEIDVLLTDLMMPGTDGKTLANLARGFRPGLPVLLMSGFPGAVSEAGPGLEFSILQKPFRKSDLEAAIITALNESRKEAA